MLIHTLQFLVPCLIACITLPLWETWRGFDNFSLLFLIFVSRYCTWSNHTIFFSHWSKIWCCYREKYPGSAEFSRSFGWGFRHLKLHNGSPSVLDFGIHLADLVVTFIWLSRQLLQWAGSLRLACLQYRRFPSVLKHVQTGQSLPEPLIVKIGIKDRWRSLK